MAMNREFEAEIGYNKGRPKAEDALKSLRTQYNLLVEAKVIRERPIGYQAPLTERLADSLLIPFEKSLRFALQNLTSPTALMGSNLFDFQEIKGRIPNMEALESVDRAKALQGLLQAAIEAIKVDPLKVGERRARSNMDAYEVIYRFAILGKTNERVEEELSISRMTFYRRQGIGIQRMMEFLLSSPGSAESSH